MKSEPASDLDPAVLGEAVVAVLAAHGVTAAGMRSIVARYDPNSTAVLHKLAGELGVPFDVLLGEICTEMTARTSVFWHPKAESLR